MTRFSTQSIILSVLTVTYLFGCASSESSETISRLPSNEIALATADVCSANDGDWFQSILFDDSLGNAVIRYRYCERAETITTFEQCFEFNGRTHYTTRKSYADDIACTDYRTKTLPEGVEFRAFLSLYDSDAVLAFSQDGTVCFLPESPATSCETGRYCTSSGECDPNTGSCRRTNTVCYARDAPAKMFNILLKGLDDGREAFWVEVELDPTSEEENPASKDDTNEEPTNEDTTPGTSGQSSKTAAVVWTTIIMISMQLFVYTGN